jgi:glucokinase
MGLTIGVDVGGTKIAAGVVDDYGIVVETVRRDTPDTDERATQAAIVGLVEDLSDRHEISAVGVGLAGYIDSDRSTVRFAPNLSPYVDWRNVALGEWLSEALGLRVTVENDANAAAWGEFVFGAGRDVEDLLLVTVGTGVGGGLVTEGHLYRGAFGIATEIGHMRVVPNGLECPCGQYGCFEQYASGRALVREARDRIIAKAPEAETLSRLIGGNPDLLTGPMVTEQARDGDALACEIFAEVGRWLGEGIAALVAVLDPGMVAIGGGVADAGDLLLEPARRAMERSVTAAEFRRHGELRLARLGGAAGMIGAADLAKSS